MSGRFRRLMEWFGRIEDVAETSYASHFVLGPRRRPYDWERDCPELRLPPEGHVRLIGPARDIPPEAVAEEGGEC